MAQAALGRDPQDMDMNVYAVVLAAGQGRRMGGPKHLLPVGPAPGRPMLLCVLEALSRLPLAGLGVVLRSGDGEGERLVSNRGARSLFAEPGEGRAASVRAGVRAAPPGPGGVLFAMADQPLLRANDFRLLIDAFAARPGGIVAARYADQRGTPVLFDLVYRDELLALRGSQGGRVVISAHPERVSWVSLPAERGRDVDRPEDLAALRAGEGGPVAAGGGEAGDGPGLRYSAAASSLSEGGTQMASHTERTLSIIKPDAVAAGKIGAILAQIEASGLRLVGLRMLQLSEDQAREFYAVHRERPFYGSLVEFMTSGPIVVSALEADDAIQRYRKLMGATNPEQADPGTLRKNFGTNVERNATHGSDGPDTASQELRFFFPDL